MFASVLVLVFLSGLTGLIYQVTWQKYLSIFLGSHALATALVLGVFFLFLSLGYFAAGRYSSRLMKNKLLMYGVVELIIGIYGLVSSEIFHGLNEILAIHTEGFLSNLLLGLVFTSLFIGLPTFLMGATIPILTYGLSKTVQESHRTHALIYGVNTLGAFLGTLIAGFYLIEEFGLPLTLALVGILNVLIFIGSAGISRNYPDAFDGCPPAPSADAEVTTPTFKKTVLLAYVISFLSGFYVFTLESLVIRMAGVSIGSSTYTYTIVVAAFIFAIGLGSVLVAKMSKWPPHMSLLVSQAMLILTAIGSYLLIPKWPEIFVRVRLLVAPSYMNFEPYWAIMFLLSLVILVPFVVFMGMNLPLLFGQLRYSGPISRVTGQLYGVNCAGCFVGAIVGGYWIFTVAEVHNVFKLALFAILIATFAMAAVTKLTQTFNKAWLAGFSVILLIAAVVTATLPKWGRHAFAPALYYSARVANTDHTLDDVLKNFRKWKDLDFKASFTDPNTLVDVVDRQTARTLYLNGKPDATTDGDAPTRALAALIPISIAPFEVKKVFISGLGAGLSMAIASKFKEVERVDVAEISQGVIEALPFFNDYNYDLRSRAEKFHIINGDAYKILKDASSKYDIMLSEPTHPWVSGVEKLYTYDFYKIAATKLREDGFYVQWLPAFTLDIETILTVLNGFNQAFLYTSVWSTGGSTFALVGSNKPYHLVDEKRLLDRFQEQSQVYEKIGFKNPYSILGLQALSAFAVANLIRDVEPTHTLENPVMEYQAGRTYFSGAIADLDTLILPLNTMLAYNPSPENRFLLESIWPSIPQGALVEARKYIGEAFRFQKERLNHLIYLKGDTGTFKKLTPLTKNIFAALSSGDIKNLPDMNKPENMAALCNNAHIFYNSSQPVHFDLFAKILNPVCTNDDCRRAKIQAIVGCGLLKHQTAATQLAQSGSLEKQTTAIDDLYKQAFTAKK